MAKRGRERVCCVWERTVTLEYDKGGAKGDGEEVWVVEGGGAVKKRRGKDV